MDIFVGKPSKGCPNNHGNEARLYISIWALCMRSNVGKDDLYNYGHSKDAYDVTAYFKE